MLRGLRRSYFSSSRKGYHLWATWVLCGVKSTGKVKLKRWSVPSRCFWGSCHQLDGQKPGLEGRTHPQGWWIWPRLLHYPRLSQGGKGRCGSYASPKSASLRDAARRELAMMESVNSIPSLSLSSPVKHPEFPNSQLLGTQLSALQLIQFRQLCLAWWTQRWCTP